MAIEFDKNGRLKVPDKVIEAKRKQAEKEERDKKVKPQQNNEFFKDFLKEFNDTCLTGKDYFKDSSIIDEIGKALSEVVIQVEYEDIYGKEMEPP